MPTISVKYLSLFSGVGGFELGIQRAYDNSEVAGLAGGFPCQAFSVAGKRHGFNDTRGTLFFDIARILSHKRPRHLVLENVKGLLSHDSGKTFQTILGVLTDLGYDVEWQVLNAKDFGVPQNRERIFIVGHLGGECGRQVFPIGASNPKTLREVTSKQSQGYRVYDPEGLSTTIATQAGELGAKTGLYISHVDRGKGIRRLTPIECERFMSWPDNWTIGSDPQRYKQCGNGVVSNVVQAVIERMKLCLL